MKSASLRSLVFHAFLAVLTLAAFSACSSIHQPPDKPIPAQLITAQTDIQMTNPTLNRQLRLVFSQWAHKWECYMFGNCQTTFSGVARLIDSTNGQPMSWNTIETWSQDDCGASPAETRWPKVVHNTMDAPFGWGTKDGKANHASVFFRFSGNEGTWTAFAKSTACP